MADFTEEQIKEEIQRAGRWLADNPFRMTMIHNHVGEKAPAGIRGFITGWVACAENTRATSGDGGGGEATDESEEEEK